MDAFESIIAMLVQREGYWTSTNYKITLDAKEKGHIGLPSCPRWEFDVIAYKAATNTVLVIECKSFLDSKGVRMTNGKLMRENRYKLFNDDGTRDVVLTALRRHLLERGMCRDAPTIRLVLAAGKIARKSRAAIRARFDQEERWELWDETWIGERLEQCAKGGYENSVACLTAKLLIRHQRGDRFWSDGSDIRIVD